MGPEIYPTKCENFQGGMGRAKEPFLKNLVLEEHPLMALNL